MIIVCIFFMWIFLSFGVPLPLRLVGPQSLWGGLLHDPLEQLAGRYGCGACPARIECRRRCPSRTSESRWQRVRHTAISGRECGCCARAGAALAIFLMHTNGVTSDAAVPNDGVQVTRVVPSASFCVLHRR